MIPRVLIGALLAGLAMFAWGAVWNTALPFARNVLQPVRDPGALVGTLADQRMLPGVYQWPSDPGPDASPEAREAYIAEHERGPVGMVFIARGTTPMGADTLLAGLVHILLVALLLAVLLAMVLSALPSYGMRVLFCTLVMTVGATFINLGYPIFFYLSWPYWVASFFFDVISGLIAGLVLGAVLPRTAPAGGP